MRFSDERKKKDKQIIMHYMRERDVPSWYRGTSPFQIEAADQLANAIRDDLEQNTSDRVHQCLIRLGLSPRVHTRDLKTLMKLSGGNDLAFLWFLMELYYKTKGNKYDSVNEQLILSSIAHLDMITTLRELDRILPPGNVSQRQLEMRIKQKDNRRCWHGPAHKLVKKRSSPYFDKLERPRPYGKPLVLERPDFKVRFFRYEAYKDPNYVAPNEENRWYADYGFHDSERITKTALREYLAELMKSIEREIFPFKSFVGTSSIINYAIGNVDNEFDQKILCQTHRLQEEEKEMRRLNQYVKQLETCEKHLELFRGKKKARLEKITQQLEKEIEAYRLRYRRMKKPHVNNQSYIRVLGKDDYCEYMINDDSDMTCEINPLCNKSPSAVSLKDFRRTIDSKYSGQTENYILHKRNRLSFDKSRFSNSYDFNYFNVLTPPSSQRFFLKPTVNKPFQFNYPKIFNYKDENNKKFFIKNKCVEALDEEPRNVPKTVDLTPDIPKVAKYCASQTWIKSRDKWNAEQEEEEVEQVKKGPIDPYPAKMPRQPFYDCEDKILMDEMLQIALDEMKKQPKFVLASLPDAYKMPMLREWIAQRYGKRYTHAQQINELNMSIRIMKVLQNIKIKNPLPRPSMIAVNLNQNYGCHHYIMKKVNILRRRFYDRMNADLLKRTRYYWFAMRNSMCLLPQRQTFFAYSPSRPVDNYLFKPWKASEYMDAKSVFEARRMKAEIDSSLH